VPSVPRHLTVLLLALTAAAPALLPVTPLSPDDGATITAQGKPVELRLTWSAPSQPIAARFFVEVIALGQGAPREVFASYVGQSSVVVVLQAEPADYAWRVDTVGKDDATYALGPWRRFAVRTGS
jgi:hypothetical protein